MNEQNVVEAQAEYRSVTEQEQTTDHAATR